MALAQPRHKPCRDEEEEARVAGGWQIHLTTKVHYKSETTNGSGIS